MVKSVRRVVFATLLSLCGATVAHAEGFDIRQFYPIAGSQGVFSVESAKTLEHLKYDIKLTGDYANTPFLFYNGDLDEKARLDHLVSLTLSGAVGILGFLEVGVTLPFIAYEDFNNAYINVPTTVIPKTGTAVVGDMQIRAKGTILNDLNGFSLGAGVILSMPTGKDTALTGDASFWGRPYIAADYAIGPVDLMVNAGFTFRKKAHYLDYTSSHGFNYGFGVNWHAIEEWLDVKGEIYGETPMSSKAEKASHQASEFLLGAKVFTPIGVHLTAGAGAGIGSGVKNPLYRVLFGVEYQPTGKDTDGDGIYDRHDVCPDIPGLEEFEGCPNPDADQDKWCDAWITDDALAIHFGCQRTDRCPDIAGTDAFEGCPNPDSDGDGVCDTWIASAHDISLEYACTGTDSCPDIAGEPAFDGCPNPDSDKDGWCDAWINDETMAQKYACKMTDLCPDQPGLDDFKGCPDADPDQDGICAPFVENYSLHELYFCSGVDMCPDEPEDFDNFQDEDGCPDPDNDHDGICDPWVSELGLLDKYKDLCIGVDQCPMEPETINGVKDDDGCPDKGKHLFFCFVYKIEIKDKIYFDNNKATIKKKSHSLLDQLAQTIKASPDIAHLSVEGHTDDTGKYERNMTLSRQRAQAVIDYLVSKGIAPQRLTAVGYGPDKPLDPAKTSKARALNRRVEFVITQRKP